MGRFFMFQAIWVIIGSLIGAGFASGKEIYYFFYQYGEIGAVGILLASCLFGYLIWKTFTILDHKPIRNYREFLEEIMGKPKGMPIVHKMINVFILLEFYIMVAGFGAYLNQEFGIPSFIGAIILSIATYFTCKRSMQGIEKANKIVIPILILFIIHMGVQNVDNHTVETLNFEINVNQNLFLGIGNAVLYASYNGILLVPVLIGLKNEKNRKNNGKIAGITAILIAILALCIFHILMQGSVADYTSDIPIVQIARSYGEFYPFLYGIMIAISIYTSAIAICFGLLENVATLSSDNNLFLLKCVCVSSVFVSCIGFSNLVERLYPLLGIFGSVQILFLIRYKCKESIEKKVKIV